MSLEKLAVLINHIESSTAALVGSMATCILLTENCLPPLGKDILFDRAHTFERDITWCEGGRGHPLSQMTISHINAGVQLGESSPSHPKVNTITLLDIYPKVLNLNVYTKKTTLMVE